MADKAVELPFSAAKLRNVRERAGYSRPGLAARSGITSQHIGRLERGECMPTAPTLKALREGLGVELDELLDAEPARA